MRRGSRITEPEKGVGVLEGKKKSKHDKWSAHESPSSTKFILVPPESLKW